MKPARPLKSLLIQAENDDGDLAEMRDGVIAGLGLTAEQAKQSAENVVVFCEDERTGPRFFLETVEPLLAEHRPDLVWIDPVLSYLGGETNSQKDVGAFLRNGLNPLLHEFKCGAIVVHHTNKPPRGEEKQNWAAGDFAYIGSGSAEWANWARAVIGLRSIGLHDVYELRAGKRGARLGWREADGTTKSFVKYIGHSLDHGKIYWREVEAPAVNPLGRPKRCREDEVFKILPAGGLPTTEWQKRAEQECGISRTSFFRLIDLLERNERILKSTISDKWQPILKTH